VIVVVGRPALAAATAGGPDHPAGSVALIALAAAGAGAAVELVGAVGDDDRADALAVALGRAGVGHAALLRLAGATTPRWGDAASSWPRLDAADLDLGLRYLPECRVLVLAEPLPPAVRDVALEAASYHGAAIIAIAADDGPPDERLAQVATVLVAPDEAISPFAELIGRFAAALDGGEEPGPAFRRAVAAVGWEPAGGPGTDGAV
jgi:ribokinase